MRSFAKYSIALLLLILLNDTLFAQKHKVSFKDSLDHAFDMSDYIIDAHGFIPIPDIITEKALGGFGIALAPVFLKKRKPFVDSIGDSIKVTPVAPDITGALGGWTVNNSWFGGLFRSGTWAKPKIKYMVGGIYADINMSYYRTLFNGDNEKEFKFNNKTYGALLQAIKKVGTSDWYVGLRYMIAETKVKYRPDTAFPPFVTQLEKSSLVSQLGAIVEFDNRDNIFTPNSGMKLHVDAICSNEAIASDYDYWRFDYYAYMYKTLFQKLTVGLRIDGQQVVGDVPFYFLPNIDMRGVPTNRYQGKADLLSELEFRYDVFRRWSVMLYGGTGKAFDKWSEWGNTDYVFTYGTGFRYLIARKFKLRMGIDVAKGPEDWTYYIVFGSNWLR